jgi:formylglycine-generating enzyme required for sulfatase activity
MIKIPGGKFYMGAADRDALPFEKPQHQVRLTPYCIDELEITTEQYKACSDVGACPPNADTNDWPGISEQDRALYDMLCNRHDPAKRARHPINCVDWEMATKFCANAGGRLPTEAEWEFAARGTDGRKYPWGNDPPSAELLNACGAECVDWCKKNHVDLVAMYPQNDKFPTTADVGSFPKGKSFYGLQDVVGNVWEWVADYWAPYEPAEVTDPKGPTEGTDHVLRGGSWNGSDPAWVRPTFRYHAASKTRGYAYGFRCARSL